ncbi:hypothetical protein ACQ4M3_08900 [Leptolyngbya sp. AN03gr2]|uniref:hypothetical protein n=1 Tax=unclassified Leptolyngbya TaxID=2650499 RepID=UPI003D314FA3
MHDEHLYAQNARDHAEIAEYWARQAKRYAHSIDLPGAMTLSIAISLLIFSLILTIGGMPNAQCR